MKTARVLRAFLLTLMILFTPGQPAEAALNGATALSSTLGSPSNYPLPVNQLSAWVKNSAQFISPTGALAVSYPRQGEMVVFEEGMVWGGLAKDGTEPVLRIGGGDYHSNLKPGRILTAPDGQVIGPEDATLESVRIYRTRPDYTIADLTAEAEYWYGSGSMAEALRFDYARDWQQWPADQGAPYQDVNHNGVYDAATDIPGIPGAHQTLWYVANDLYQGVSNSRYGCPSIGMELQMTVWAFDFGEQDPLSHTMFKRCRLIYKGTPETPASARIDSMYIAQWSDPDLGTATDDLVGCDVDRNLGYCYQIAAIDEAFARRGLPPPAIGYALLQGPMVPDIPLSTAWFDFKKIRGFSNLKMTTFSRTGMGTPDSHPSVGPYEGALHWYNMMRGFRPRPVSPPTPWTNHLGQPTPFLFSGDPLHAQGDVDFIPCDHQMTLASGPFTMSKGDTQEVVIALIAAMGLDNLSSIDKLRQHDRAVQYAWKQQQFMRAPLATASTQFINGKARIDITVDARGFNTSGVMVDLTNSQTGVTEGPFPLADLGNDPDEALHDGIFSGRIEVQPCAEGLILDVRIYDQNLGVWRLFPAVLDHISTAGPVRMQIDAILSDNLNNDLKANPGENIRFSCRLTNESAFSLKKVRLFVEPNNEKKTYVMPADELPPLNQWALGYANDYCSIDIPADFNGSTYPVQMILLDRDNNRWTTLVNLPIYPVNSALETEEAQHVAGLADGNFQVRIIDPLQIKNHVYHILGEDGKDEAGNRRFTLFDSTENRIVWSHRALPDELGHTILPVEGFKILRGSLAYDAEAGMKSGSSLSTPDTSQWGWSIPSGSRTWSWVNAVDPTFAPLEGFDGAIGYREMTGWFMAQGSLTPPEDLKNVLIKFAATDIAGNVLDGNDPDWSYGYRYLRRASQPAAKPEFAPFIKNTGAGYPFQDYTRSMPFSAWDMESDPPRRLMVGHLENNHTGGSVDGKYWPPSSQNPLGNYTSGGPREIFFIFDVTYSETPDPQLQVDILNELVPVMYLGAPTRRNDAAFGAEDEFMIYPVHFISSRDIWRFTPGRLVSVAVPEQPLAWALEQNYPNPFNPETRFRFTLASPSHVSLKVYNALGEEVACLIDRKMNAGSHQFNWFAKNSSGRTMASGLYFYHLRAGDFAQTRKMLLVR